MLPFIVLSISFLLLRALGAVGVHYLNGWIVPLRTALAIMFLLTASAHWGKRRPDLVRMVPPAFPTPGLLVTITGVLEIMGAIGLMIPRTAPAAAICLAILLIAMFPANVHAARHGLVIAGKPATRLPLRFALQLVFITVLVAAAWAGH
jgi:uncharacterized membrane protein